MNKMKSWDEYYFQWYKADYDRHILAQKGFGNRIARFTPENSSILEVGFGTGQISIYLSLMDHKNYKCYGIDNNRQQVLRAHKLALELKADVHFQELDFMTCDLNKLKYDTVFSQGVLEHFEIPVIKEWFDRQFQISKVVAFSVPLDKFGHQSRGDEILRPESEWKEITNKYIPLYWETFAKGTQLMGILAEVKV